MAQIHHKIAFCKSHRVYTFFDLGSHMNGYVNCFSIKVRLV